MKPISILTSFTLLSAIPLGSASENLPYPQSEVITGIEFDWSTHKRSAPGSDNFRLTWADDDNLYGAWGDGGGFGGNNKDGRVGLGVARIEGSGDDYRGYNVWGGFEPENKSTFNGKNWSMIAIDDMLYMHVSPDVVAGKGYRNHYEFIELAQSSDYGASWEKLDWTFLQSENLTVPTFLNFGKANAGVPKKFGKYVYTYFIRPECIDMEHQGPNQVGLIVHKPGVLYLSRTPTKAFPPAKEDFEFFTGLNSKGKPTWGSLEEKAPVFENKDGVGWCLSASYHPEAKRVLLSTEHGKSHAGQIGIFDAPTPWGPWSTVAYFNEDKPFGAERPGSDLEWENNVFFVSFPTKWFDGNDFTMNFTGSGGGKDNDSFNTIQGRFLTQSSSSHGQFRPHSIQPYAKNKRYWQYNGEPILLVGGSVDDNLFQLPDLENHLDAIKAAGGNYIRNTMSDRPDHGSEVYPYKQLEDGRFDLDQWNPEYWIRFENLLKESAKRDIIVQLEIWDRFDHSRENWEPSPYNPKNNINYSYEESGFEESYPEHPGKNRQPFFFTTPEQRNSRLILGYQRRFVDKILSYSLNYDNILYCQDNETSGEEAWAIYWANFLHARANAARKAICLTEMWDSWDLKNEVHLRTLNHPERYEFIDASQNNHNSGEKHWDALVWTRNYTAAAPRPINSVKVYGAGGNKFGHTDQDGIERFWRYLTGGAASVRFHRPPSGLGLSEKAIASIQSVRFLERFLKLWNLQPAQELLGKRDENEAYLAADPGNGYALYFTNGGSVSLDLSAFPEPFALHWISIDAGKLESTATIKGGGKRTITTPTKSGNWVAAVIPLPQKR